MKCGVLTFHRASNYGAVFQTYALQRFLNSNGIESEVIDYRCPFIEKHITPKRFIEWIRPFNMYRLLFKNAYILDNRKNFAEFVKNYIPVSDEEYNPDNIKNANELYDIFIVGSDQIWSNYCAGFDKNYFLEFVNDKKKKNSYSASFGFVEWPVGLEDEYHRLLADFNAISIREVQGAKLVNRWNDIKAEWTLDPVFLLSKEEWISITAPIENRKPYLVLYLMTETKSIIQYAKKVAKERNLEVIYVSERLLNHCGMKNKKKSTPVEWLSLINSAEFIVTNSFHGTALSIILEKDFSVELLPEPSKVNSRITDVLHKLNLSGRIINNNNCDLKRINYAYVNKHLHNYSVESKEYLLKILRDK